MLRNDGLLAAERQGDHNFKKRRESERTVGEMASLKLVFEIRILCYMSQHFRGQLYGGFLIQGCMSCSNALLFAL
jgi:hypothetical protein